MVGFIDTIRIGFKDSLAKPKSYEEYKKKLRRITAAYTSAETTNNGIVRQTHYELAFMNENNLIVLLSFLEKILVEEGYDSRSIAEVKNPNLFMLSLKETFRDSVHYEEEQEWAWHIKVMKELGPVIRDVYNNKNVDLDEFYIKFKEIWDMMK